MYITLRARVIDIVNYSLMFVLLHKSVFCIKVVHKTVSIASYVFFDFHLCIVQIVLLTLYELLSTYVC
jgi:hypothetical protein